MYLANYPSQDSPTVFTDEPNFLFVGSDRGGRAAAVAYSLIETCKLHGVEPYAYLADVLRRLPAHPINRVAELLPFRWKPAA